MSVTRFAPSPTGFLHLGHAYSALTAFEAARASGGRFLLRIEDVDRGRARADCEAAICDDLAWLGLQWEKPVRRQSEHFDEYKAVLTKLDSMGVLYPCFCTRKDIAEEILRAGGAPHLMGPDGAIYPGTCRALSSDERAERIASGAPYALRLDVAKAVARIGHALVFHEFGAGPDGECREQSVQAARLGDVVLARKDMPASYHIAVVADDALQGVDLVTRGHDLFHATHVQRVLQALLGLPVPTYAHHRLIVDETGKKFSKRDFAVTLRAMRKAGVAPADIRSQFGFAAHS